jgi:vacuolar protein sorting-associated protein 29
LPIQYLAVYGDFSVSLVVALYRPVPAVVGPCLTAPATERGRHCTPHHRLQPPNGWERRASWPYLIGQLTAQRSSPRSQHRRVCVIQRPALTTTSFISRDNSYNPKQNTRILATTPNRTIRSLLVLNALRPIVNPHPTGFHGSTPNPDHPESQTPAAPSRPSHATMAFLILVIGDLHIPDRAFDIPAKFKKLLAPGKIAQTLCLGNLTDKATYEYLRTMAPDLKIVKGRMDVEATSLPLTQVVTHGAVRIGFLEGFTLVSSEPDVLLAEANRLDVDVLCWSGGTHRFECFEYMDKFFVNPGSATGAFTTNWALPEKEGGEEEEVVPSFCLMDVSGRWITTDW